MKIVTSIIAIVVLAGIGYIAWTWSDTADNGTADVAREETLTCADGTAVNVQYLEDENIIVTLEGTPYELSPVVSASGARYANADESFVFWNQGTESMVLVDGEVVYRQCRTDDAPGERTTTEPLVNGYALSFVVPPDAEYSVEATSYHKVLFASANNEPPALTDGWTVTMTLLEKPAEMALRTFVEGERDSIQAAAGAEIQEESFFGHEAYLFNYQTGLGTNATDNYVRVDDATVARITVSAIGSNAQQYRADINAFLESITFEQVGNSADVSDMIRLDSPQANEAIESPFTIEGEARGTWYFEANFSVALTDWDGRIIAEGPVAAEGEWMTEEFVPFSTELAFESPYSTGDPDFMKRGTLILEKANPSGLPENAAALEIPVRFAE